ncbi:hypothetical protein FJNA_02190 [Thermus sp. FJN-A]
MKRWLYAGLGVLLLLALGLLGYRVYASYQALAARVAGLETRVQAQEEALKALSERLARVEGEVFKAPSPPLSLPEVPQAGQAPAWPYVVGALVVLLLAYLILRLFRTQEAPGKGREAPVNTTLEEARMEEEGAPPKKEG